MGNFFKSLQVQNKQHLSQQEFLAEFSNQMNQRGYEAATEEDGECSYCLMFSEKNNWVTIGATEEADLRPEAKWLAKAFQSTCVLVEVVDSDFAMLKMYNEKAEPVDEVVVSDATGYGFEEETTPRGKKECWQPLLTKGSTWEQLTEIWCRTETYAEDSVEEMVPLLGMDADNVLFDFRDAEENENTVFLQFKKVDTKQTEKMPSLNVAFKKVYGEALEPLGFVKVKGRQPYFVRMVGDEILHIIAIKPEHSLYYGFKDFTILGGVATVYRREIDFTRKPDDNSEWLTQNCYLSYKIGKEYTEEYHEQIRHFSYKDKSAESLYQELQRSLKVTKEIMLPMLNQVTSLEKCIDFVKIANSVDTYVRHAQDMEYNRWNDQSNEGLLYMITTNHSENELKEHLGDVYNDPDLQKRALKELERRKEANTKALREYGLKL